MVKQGRWPGAWPWEMNLKGQVPGPAVWNLTWIILTITGSSRGFYHITCPSGRPSWLQCGKRNEDKEKHRLLWGTGSLVWGEKWQWLEWMHVKWGGEKWIDLSDIKETESIRIDLLSFGKEESNSGFSGHKSSRLAIWETGTHRVSHGSKETN